MAKKKNKKGKKKNNPYGGKKGSKKAKPLTKEQSQAMFQDALGITNQFASADPEMAAYLASGRPGQDDTTGREIELASLQDRILYGSNADAWEQVARTLGLDPNQRGKKATTKMAQYVMANPIGVQSGGGMGIAGSGSGGGLGLDGEIKNDGSLGSVIGLIKQDIEAAKAATAELANKEVDMGDFDEKFGYLEGLLNQQLNTGLDELLMKQSEGYEAQIAEQQKQFDEQLDLIKAGYEETSGLMADQLKAANEAVAAAQSKAANLQTAFVPQANPTALSVAYGDNREMKRKQKNNQLSDLTILSGLGTASNPLAGLQLA